eukprot:c39017_g1_i1.p1 GENE.c39017_g1_i1~~c39017_g1_i1.p1  ORF type:complete len:305 (+),score=65.44 c39017_g1_i1:32-916(+)
MRRWAVALFVVGVLFVSPVQCGEDDSEEDDEKKPSAPSSSSGGACEWVSATGRNYDLSGMIRTSSSNGGDWKAEEDIQGFKFDYYFNICGDSMKGCNNHKTSSSQYQIFGGTSAGCIPLGEAWSEGGKTNVEWSEFGTGADPKSGGVIIKYKNGQVCSTGGEKFSFSIKIPCGEAKRDPSQANDGLDPKKFVVEQDSASGCQYTIQFPAIQDGCPASGSGDWGWLVIGVFIAVVVVYFGVGVAFRVKKLGHSGKDAIPHLEFWESVPGLVLDGVRFSIEQTKEAYNNFQESRKK